MIIPIVQSSIQGEFRVNFFEAHGWKIERRLIMCRKVSEMALKWRFSVYFFACNWSK
jgi:hypothetical protein